MKKDSLKINQNNDGSFTAEWDKNDPEWSFLNGKTSKEIQEMIENIVKNEARRRGYLFCMMKIISIRVLLILYKN